MQLLSHLDDGAVNKIIGYKGDYKKAMAALDWHYNKCAKIVTVCTREINALHDIEDRD